MPLVSRTRATLRSAEFGFLGVCVNTRTQTPRFCGQSSSAGLLVLLRIFVRLWRTSWLIVGILFNFPTGPAGRPHARLPGKAAGARQPARPQADLVRQRGLSDRPSLGRSEAR